MNYSGDYIDDDFIDYEMNLQKIKGNEFTFLAKLANRIEYGQTELIINFLRYECLFYLRHRFPKLVGSRVVVRINRDYTGKIHNFAMFEVVL